MIESMRTRFGIAARIVLLVVCGALLVALVAGCSGGAGAGGGSEQKAMLETVGKYYAAQGELDLPAMRAALYDPQNISGIATATVPAGSEKAEVDWKYADDKVVIVVPSQDLTLTVTPAESPANALTMSDPSGQSLTLIMKKDGGVWKIDVSETQKAGAAKAGAPSGQGAP